MEVNHPGGSRRSLTLTDDEMRELGYRVVDAVIAHLGPGRDDPVAGIISREEMERLLREPIPREGREPLEVLDRVRRDVLSHVTSTDHPRFYAYVPGSGNFVSTMADTLASGFNVFAGHWLASAGAAQIEDVTIQWLCELLGLPDGAGGIFLSGGSMANTSAIATARLVRFGAHRASLRVYASDQTHDSLSKGLRFLGFESSQLRVIATDEARRLRLDALEAAIAEDRVSGHEPLAVVANAGTTNTGAVDPLRELAALCDREAIWLHVDGAYGAAAVLSERGRKLLDGIERADSITLDPHKWWFQPFEIGGLLVRDREHLRQAFHAHGDYLSETRGAEEEINFYDLGPQLTRGFRALKLWMSLQVFGLDAFREAVEGGIERAERAEARLRESGRWDVVTPAELGVVTFRPRASGLDEERLDAVTHEIVRATLEDGYAFVTTTKLDGRPVLRLCPIHPRASEEEMRETVGRLERFFEEALSRS